MSEAVFLCAAGPGELLEAINPEWNALAMLPLVKKCAVLQIDPASLHLFPQAGPLSQGIDPHDFTLSHLIQPDVFIRVRPGCHATVQTALQKAAIRFTAVDQQCISMPAATKVEAVIQLNKEAVIQDYSSQQTGALMLTAAGNGPLHQVWDCCAASGGKSILAKDSLDNIELTVSDIRSSVLNNLKKRFTEAAIKNYTLLQADLTKPTSNQLHLHFDLVIADAPCTGSGTWGRTPERLSYFDRKEIDHYSQLQQKIVTSVIPCIKNGGYLLYITCSVFEKENEEIVDFIRGDSNMQLLQTAVLKGYTMKADTMFAALFRKI